MEWGGVGEPRAKYGQTGLTTACLRQNTAITKGTANNGPVCSELCVVSLACNAHVEQANELNDPKVAPWHA